MRDRINLAAVMLIAGMIAYYSIRPLPAPDYGTGPVTLSLVYHAAAYFGLAAALLLYFHDTPKGHFEAVAAAAGFGALMEGTQFFLTTRVFSPIDAAVNLLGAAVVLLDHQSRLVTRVIRTEDRILAWLIGASPRADAQ